MSLFRKRKRLALLLVVNEQEDHLVVTAAVPHLRLGVPSGSRVRLGPDSVEYHVATPPPAPGDQVSMPWRVSTRDSLVTQLNEARTLPHWPLALAGVVLLGSVTPWLAVLGLPVLLWLALRDKIRRTVWLTYDLDRPAASAYAALLDSFHQHAKQDDAFASKLNSALQRRPLARTTSGPPRLRADDPIPTLTFPAMSVFLLPDRILWRERGVYREVCYKNLSMSTDRQVLPPVEPAPRDSGRPVMHTHGDLTHGRSSDEGPVYGRLALAGTGGFGVVWWFSRELANEQLANGLAELQAYWQNRSRGIQEPW